ncbi:hypothetical protein AOQ84DRAFT_310495, partial [Glonium stellatum]
MSAMKSSASIAGTASTAYQASKERATSVDYNKFFTDAQAKFHEAKDHIRTVDYSQLPAEAQAKFREAKDHIAAVDYKSLPADVKDWVVAHPYQTAFHVTSGVLLIAPGLLSEPLLGLLGWTSAGPRAASVAAGIQSAFGTGAAGGAFATLQSAAMGGYGVPAVAWAVRGVTGAFQAASWALGKG